MILNKKTHGRPDNHEDIKEMKTVTYIQRYPDNRTPVSDKMAGSVVTTVCGVYVTMLGIFLQRQI